ncbi:hypothetical protein Pan44_02480 [Caulifigura coniformis]|uniref:Galactosyl transferase GMA12/MNN10 family protein n=1 Tax=Caulifigura coniformis TaxID=2527983 RepID=A0A517S7X9_9PLAN|nr:hypothetical protein [Caulifigura coniformis]QDT52239.1 hypothetical protein Pan44_02480 [Caulifigura coniformis]
MQTDTVDQVESPTKSLPTVTTDDFVILTCHFNPQGYRRPVENYHRFREALGGLAEYLFSAELSFNGTFETDAQIRLHGDRRNRCWQKEAMLNLLLRQLPPSIRYVAWIDRDIKFLNATWMREAVEMLASGHFAVQLLESLVMLDRWGIMNDLRDGVVVTSKDGLFKGFHGAAWAARKDYLDAIGGLPSRHIVGGADSLMAATWLGRGLDYLPRAGVSKGLIRWSERWAKGARDAMHGMTCGHVPGTGMHFHHGDRTNRRYNDRHTLLRAHGFDPDVHTRVNADGLIELHVPPALASTIEDYFVGRREDE